MAQASEESKGQQQVAAKLIIGEAPRVDQSTLTVSQGQAMLLLQVLKTKSLSSIETASSSDGQHQALPGSLASSADFWKNSFAALSDGATIQLMLQVESGSEESIRSMATMHGFSDIQFSNPDFSQGSLAVIARKVAFKPGGTALRRKPKATQPAATESNANPWANLREAEGANQINEDSLMQDENAVQAVTDKFAGECDRIMPGKPCENCTCGKKELLEGKITLDQLETGQVESSCGKCYLGDAFRCAGCPFRGKPAFEPGDKVKIQGADTTSAAADASMVRQEGAVTTAQTGSTKVVLEL